ncbi:MAG: RNA polymerase sigma factor [Planctomycetes bacterium]|nr:RNA polymerase sigma factor [Planctomycetota bacterium]
MTEPTDADLLRSWRRGDATAFAALVDRYQGPLLAFARFLPCGASGAEDVVQEVLLRLARNPPELPRETAEEQRPPEARLASWLYRVTRNCAMEQVRSDARRRIREERTAPREMLEGGPPAIEQDDTRRAVEEGLLALAEDQREALVLRLFGERSYREIAEITGQKAGTVAWLISEGLKTLSRRLAPLLDLEPARRERVAGLTGETS